jgi:plasmid stability protein
LLIGVRMRAARHGWSMEQNEGRLSNVLAKEMPVLDHHNIRSSQRRQAFPSLAFVILS